MDSPPTKVQQVSEELEKMIAELQSLASDGKIGLIGRREMFNRLRRMADWMRRLVALLGSI